MKIIADTHCHTIASTHAYNTLEEMSAYAAKIGLKAIGITDHGPKMTDSPHIWHFMNTSIWPDEINGVRVLKGCEANIMNETGDLDVPDRVLAKLEWIIASFHEETFEDPDPKKCLNAVLQTVKNPYVDVFGHLGNPNFKFDYEKLIALCNRYHKIIELNGNSYLVRKGSSENCREIALLCKKYKVPVILDSDAHICYRIAKVDGPMEMLREIDFPKELIVNIDEERFFRIFREHLELKRMASAE